MRCFVAIELPEALRLPLMQVQQRIDLGRAVPEDNLHLTLAFLGDVTPQEAEDLHGALAVRTFPGALLEVRGVICFGGRAPRVLAAEVIRNTALQGLRDMVARAVRSAGLVLPRARFRPHITLVRFGSGLSRHAQPGLDRSVVGIAGLTLPPARAEALALIESTLTPQGAIYDILAQYPLGTGDIGQTGG